MGSVIDIGLTGAALMIPGASTWLFGAEGLKQLGTGHWFKAAFNFGASAVSVVPEVGPVIANCAKWGAVALNLL